MNTENDIKEFGFRHISINTVYNGLAGNGVSPLSRFVIAIYKFEKNLFLLTKEIFIHCI